jgi:membrane-anchored glycerophosphoryl diester phosphodiesterase (GDPDase)
MQVTCGKVCISEIMCLAVPCCSYCAVTIYGTCNVISHAEYVVLFISVITVIISIVYLSFSFCPVAIIGILSCTSKLIIKN